MGAFGFGKVAPWALGIAIATLGSAEAALAAAALSSISASPLAAVSGQAVTGTVRMTERCPSSGCSVKLVSNSGAAVVPASIMIAGGASSGTFKFNAGAVSANTIVKLTASYGGRTRDTGTSFSISPSTQPAPSPNPNLIPLPKAAPATGLLEGMSMEVQHAANGMWMSGKVVLKDVHTTPFTVSLTSSHPDIVPVPPTMEIAAGYSPCGVLCHTIREGRFYSWVKPVSAVTIVKITATLSDGSMAEGFFSISPTHPTATTISSQPYISNRTTSQLYKLDPCFAWGLCPGAGRSITYFDMDPSQAQYSRDQQRALAYIGTFAVTPTSSTVSPGTNYFEVWGMSQAGSGAWDGFHGNTAVKSAECKKLAASKGATSYTWEPLASSSGGEFKFFAHKSTLDAYGNTMSEPYIIYAYARHFKCSWR